MEDTGHRGERVASSKQRCPEQLTHERSKGVACWVDWPIVCAKLVAGPLIGRGFARPALPIGMPPPKPQVVPLLARFAYTISIWSPSLRSPAEDMYPSFHQVVIGSIRSYSVVFVVEKGSPLACLVGIEVRRLVKSQHEVPLTASRTMRDLQASRPT